jgi:hypothetical protein
MAVQSPESAEHFHAKTTHISKPMIYQNIFGIFSNQLVLRLLVLFKLIFSQFAIQAATVSVPATAGGGFGLVHLSPVLGSTNFIVGYLFSQTGQTIEIKSSGLINIGISTLAGPDGLTLTRGVIDGYTPIEEGLLDFGVPVPIGDMDSTVLNVSALIGAFIPESRASEPGFVPLDSDIVEGSRGIFSSDLFLIGNGLTFVAPGEGRLYLGINEPYMLNNSGSFSVSVTPVPESSSVMPILFGLLLIVRKRNRH